MKRQLLLIFAVLCAGLHGLQAQTLTKGEQYAWNGFHAGDTVLLANATIIASSSAPEQDLNNVFLSSESSRSSNAWNGVHTLGVHVGLSEDNIFIIEAAPNQTYNGSSRVSFYLKHMLSEKFVKCTNGFSGDTYGQGSSELTVEKSDATSFFAQNAQAEGVNSAFSNSQSVLLAHVEGSRLLRFGPFFNYSYTYYGTGDKDAWNIHKIKWAWPVTKQTITLQTSCEEGEEMTFHVTSPDDVTVDWGNGEATPYAAGQITGTVKGSTITIVGTGQLTGLDCSGQKITGINADDAPKLITLQCAGCQLTTLSVTENEALQELDCSNNLLSKLTLSNEKLLYLDCSDNSIASLNVSKLPNLQHLMCGGNSLSGITLTSNTQLQTLWCQDNKIKKLTLTSCPDLRSIYASRNLITAITTASTNMEDVWCDDNSLTKLDLKESRPKTVNCARNQISALTMALPSSTYKPYLIDQSGNKFLMKDLYNAKYVTHYFVTDQAEIQLPFTQVEVEEYVDFEPYIKNSAGSKGTITFYDAATGKALSKGAAPTTGQYYIRSGTQVKFWFNMPAIYFKVTLAQYPDLEFVSSPFIVGDGTAVDLLQADSQEDAAIYDLQGRKVEHPTKGIYIIGNKKVLIK